MNTLWAGGGWDIAFGADSPALLERLNLKSKQSIVSKKTHDRIKFRIADLEGYAASRRTGLRYEFIYQAKSGRTKPPITAGGGPANSSKRLIGPLSDSSLISTCVKDVATIDPAQIFLDPDGTQNIYVTLESSQMIRWILAGTTPTAPTGGA